MHCRIEAESAKGASHMASMICRIGSGSRSLVAITFCSVSMLNLLQMDRAVKLG